MKFLKNNWKFLIIAVIAAVTTFFAVRDTFLTWWYDRTIIEKSGPAARVSLKSENDWLSCVYNCAVQKDCKEPGRCIAVCDARYQEVPK